MRNVLLMALLAIASHSAAADWVLVVISTDGAIASYADPASISKSGHNVKVSTMFNYKRVHVADGKTYLSYTSQDEFDCSVGAMRTTSSTFYAGNMGAGEVVTIDDTASSKFQSFQADSLDNSLWDYACAQH